jgi:hypothetical protein
MNINIEHNIGQVAKVWMQAPERLKPEVLQPLAKRIQVRFGQIAINRYMQEGPPKLPFANRYPDRLAADPGPLRKLKGQLAAGYQGRFSGGERQGETNVEISVGQSSFRLEWSRVVKTAYARIHEEGGSFSHEVPITDRMRGYLYYKAQEQSSRQGTDWMAIFIASQHQSTFSVEGSIPARPVAEPTAEDLQPFIVETAGDLAGNVLSDL